MNRLKQAKVRAAKYKEPLSTERAEFVRTYNREWQRNRRDRMRALGYSADTPWSKVSPKHQEMIKHGKVQPKPSGSPLLNRLKPSTYKSYKPRNIGNAKWRLLAKEDFEWRQGRKKCNSCGQYHLKP